MPSSSDSDVRRFRKVAFQRLEEARILLEAGKAAGAVYLAGYAVECSLKSLVLQVTPPRKRAARVKSFRGKEGHNLERLRATYRESGGAGFPRPVLAAFAVVASWDTDLRYDPRSMNPDDAEDFLRAVEIVLDWAEGRS